jgi:transposase
MYLRHTVIEKDGKEHTYWRLVKSVRTGKKVRQKTVAHLGELRGEKLEKAQALARRLGGDENRPGLFDPPLEKEGAEVRLNGVRFERVRRFGDVWLGTKLWRMAKFDEFFEAHLSEGKEEIPWGTMAEILTLARLCEPSSELHIAEDWFRKTALSDVLGVDEEKINENRLYRGLDKVLPLKSALEDHLKKRWEGLFGITFDLLLYDVTSVYFEGEAKGNPQAKRGHSRDHRPDCKQVCLGLVVTPDGMPLGYEQFAGNVHDSTTVRTIVETLEKRYGKANRVWVMDRGMVSDENLIWMREGGRRYIVGCPKSELANYKDVLKDPNGWTELKGGVKVRYAVVKSKEDAERFLLCQSEDRQKKEKSMTALFAKRIEEGLKRLKKRLEGRKKAEKIQKVERQIGRLLQRNQRSAKLFDIHCESTKDHPCGIHMEWTKKEEEQEWADQSAGFYILRTNILDWKDDEVWKTYIQLTHVENAFRIHKSELDIRPVFHQKEHRVQAHIFVCFLAYVLWKILEGWQSRARLGNSPRTILEEFSHIQSGDVVLPTITGEQLRLRCIVRPEKEQQVLLQHLGIDLPNRMRVPEFVPKM